MGNAKQATVLETRPFLEDFFAEARKAKESIWVQSMFFEPSPEMTECVEILVKAAERGLDVRLCVDWVMGKYYDSKFRVFPSLNKKWRKWKHIQAEREDILSRLARAGVTIVITNRPNIFIRNVYFVGRNHVKLFLVDGKIAWMGGVNLAAELNNKDFMVRFEDDATVSQCAEFFKRESKNALHKDYAVDCTSDTRFIADAGQWRTSLIFDETLSMITRAKASIVFVSQFVPDGKIREALLAKARSGVQVAVYTGDASLAVYSQFPLNIHYVLLRRKASRIKNFFIYHYAGKVHAKLLLCDDREAIFGSHNLVWLGVVSATAEIAMHTHNQLLITQLRVFVKELYDHQ